ncbi:MAG: PEP-CTERM sorting domain-containing protein [Verrucomicrobiota bacterium]
MRPIAVLSAFAALAAAANATTISIVNFEVRDNATFNNAFSGGGDAATADLSATLPLDGGTSGSSVVTWSNLDLDGIGGTDDVVTFTLTGTSTGTGTITHDGLGWGAAANFGAGESLVMTIGSVSVTGGSATTGSIVFDGFTAGTVIEFAGANADTVGSTMDINGNTVTANLPNAAGFQNQNLSSGAFALTPSLTYDNFVDGGTTGFAGFRARGHDVQFTFTPIPEPSVALLGGLGLLGLLRRRR